ncbi:MAG TPA: ATP-binding protein [Flavitalea sp.]|nr:ATP-binding protein [Flavitalea sp.]
MIKSRISPPMQLAIVFLLFGITWIILSDLLSMNIAHNNLNFFTRVQMYKGVFFMFIAALFIYIVSRRIFLRQHALQEQLNEERIIYRNEIALEVFNAQESERKKIGGELHDNINQLLGVVKLYIEHAQMNPASKDEMLKKSSEYLKQVINEVRGLSKSLISPTLNHLGLIESVEELIETILKIRNIQIDIHTDGFSEDVLTDNQKLMLYRITQEQLNNILKHSKAEHVDIAFSRNGRQVYFSIEDDGVGFDVKQSTSGLGLRNIRHRLELFNGNMKVMSAPEQGCRLEATFEITP